MSIANSPSSPGDSRKRPNTGRRSFIWKTGAAMSAIAASAVAGFTKTGVNPDTGLKDQVEILENANSIRRLHKAYESNLNMGLYEKVVDMFADNAEVVFNGGLFAGKAKGVRRLYCDLFRSGFTGKKMEPAPGFETNPEQLQDIVEVAANRQSATGRFPYSIQVGTPMKEDSSLVAMARLQGEGIVKWWEGGVHEVSYVKVGESWKIKRLEYRAAAKANYKPGRSCAKSIDVPVFLNVFPENPTGPDRLV